MGDWIESFLHFTRDIPSPEIFRLWTALSVVAGAANRKVWVETSQTILYPNMYVLLVAPPGIGKSQAIERAQFFWKKVPNLHVAPSSVTRASLIDSLAAAVNKVILPSKDFMLYHALNVAASEFGVLCPAHDLEFLSTLNELYDNASYFEEARRARAEKLLRIDHPMLNILAGTQPMFLSSLLPEQAWGMGFTARTLMIYSAEVKKVDIFNPFQTAAPDRDGLSADLTTISMLHGPLKWRTAAQDMIRAWYDKDLAPVPTHSRLMNYTTRRLLHVLKLCIISSISRSNDLVIELEDCQRAQGWLLEAEAKMPDVFREMAGQSDKATIDDLVDALWRVYATTKKEVHESTLIQFLSFKVPAEKIMRIMDIAEKSGVIMRSAEKAGYWKPGLRDNIRGVE